MKIYIPGKPIPKKRHRSAIRNNKIMVYDPQSSEKNHIRKLISLRKLVASSSPDPEMLENMTNLSNSEFFDVSFIFGLPIPDSSSNSQKNEKLWHLDFPSFHYDLDNFEKMYLDAMIGIFYEDDGQVIKLSSKKLYTKDAFTMIEINPTESIEINEFTEEIMSKISPAELGEFIEDCKKFVEIDVSCYSDLNIQQQQQLLSSTADLLSEFSSKYLKILKSIDKVTDSYKTGKITC